MESKRKSFLVMEWHRGEFIPLKTTDAEGKKGEGKVVKITQETANEMNRDFSKKRGQGVQIKYIDADKKAKKKEKKAKKENIVDPEVLKDLKVKYKEAFGKKPFFKN